MDFLGVFGSLANGGCTLANGSCTLANNCTLETQTEASSDDNAVFKLPISYLSTSDVLHELPDVVARDLELTVLAPPSSDLSNNTLPEKNMYEHLLQPKSKFAKNLLPAWKQHFTTDVSFLQQTQEVILTLPSIIPPSPEEPTKTEAEEDIHEIWKDIKHNDDFLEKYGYLEWSLLADWNHSAPFLQGMSICNILAPLMSFFIPIFILIIPFVLLKFQGIPITVSMYIECLTNIARNHFIGKAIMSFQNITFQNMVYLLCSLALYVLQMYQNTMQCIRFYKNTQYMNNALLSLKKHINESVSKMDAFCAKYGGEKFDRYSAFCKDVQNYRTTLGKIQEELQSVCPFECSLFKTTEIGYMMKCFYSLRVNPDYEAAILYSMGFQGYLEHLLAIQSAFQKGHLGIATFDMDPVIVDINLDDDDDSSKESDLDEDLGELKEDSEKEEWREEDLGDSEKEESEKEESEKEDSEKEEWREEDLGELKEDSEKEEWREEDLGELKEDSEKEEWREEDLGESKKEESKKEKSKKKIEKEKPPKRYIQEQAYLAHLFSSSPEETPIKNDANLDKKIIITGPNASGKTTFLKTTAINLILSQQFGMGVYRSAHFKPYTHFHSYLNIPDTSGRDSLFQAESRRCKEILDIIQKTSSVGDHHFCIFDELYSGTNPKEATKSAYAFLKYLSETHDHVDFILTTHYVSICEKWNKKKDAIRNYKMLVLLKEGQEDKYEFTYKIEPGISKIEGAIQILENMEYPDEMLNTIRAVHF